MNYSVCIDALYQGKNVLEGIRETKEAGIGAIEFWSWWDKDLGRIASERERLHLEVAAICTKFASLVDPSRHEVYLEGLKESREAAKRLGCRRLISQVGAAAEGAAPGSVPGRKAGGRASEGNGYHAAAGAPEHGCGS